MTIRQPSHIYIKSKCLSRWRNIMLIFKFRLNYWTLPPWDCWLGGLVWGLIPCGTNHVANWRTTGTAQEEVLIYNIWNCPLTAFLPLAGSTAPSVSSCNNFCLDRTTSDTLQDMNSYQNISPHCFLIRRSLNITIYKLERVHCCHPVSGFHEYHSLLPYITKEQT